ncbi:exonuclease domain-containing protein [Flammeovirga sp. EKP202]|uniref:exonuclease domain-containing protein n=1 Tax=Flammeovirga sp. EKP202 TaxID=2770592 RepID=UPI00165F15F6|nr:exonuclease domain-containing protein [Flammeovirga sp. EKP202]MBD0404586.1 3'-5' exoribonuclease [Flammeovirga sp. EKP202]
MEFTAIDFETAHGARWSICQVGIVKVKNGEIIDRYETLVRPPDNRYHSFNTTIHGITAEMTKNAPSFFQVWDEIKPFIEGQLIVAHNAGFDVGALEQTLELYDLDVPEFQYDCTYRITGAALDDVCYTYGWALNHHNALADAEACAKLYIECISEKELPIFEKNPFKKKKTNPPYRTQLSGDILKPDFENADPDSPFYRQKVVITGIFNTWERLELATIIKGLGAKINSNISGLTNIVLVGTDPGPTKLQKVSALNAGGKNIEILKEEELKEILAVLNHN